MAFGIQHGEIPLRRVIYSSQAVGGVRPDIEAIHYLLVGARHFNALHGITGMLWSDGTRFVQAIEGPLPSIEEALERIRADPMHENIDILIDMPVRERGFGDWQMGFQTLEFTDEGKIGEPAEKNKPEEKIIVVDTKTKHLTRLYYLVVLLCAVILYMIEKG